MLQDKYVLEFLPMFYDDLEGIVDYITLKLKNPDAADDLVEAVFEAMDERLPIAESFEPCQSSPEFRYTYYRIYVKNYIVFYVVRDDDPNEKVMGVRRILYNKQNYTKTI